MCRGAKPALVWTRRQRTSPRGIRRCRRALPLHAKRISVRAALRRREIPYNVIAGTGFYERQEVVDLRNLLTVLVDAWDEIALLGFLRSPLASLSDEALVPLCTDGQLVQAFYGKYAPTNTQHAARLESARSLVRELRAHTEMPLPAFLRYALDRTEYEAILLSQFLACKRPLMCADSRPSGDFGRTRPPNVAGFVHYLDSVLRRRSERVKRRCSPKGPVR